MTITARHLAIATTLGLAAMVAGAVLLYYVSFRYAADLKLPVLQQLVAAARADDAKKSDEFLRQNLNSMAVKLGEMQAQLIRLDALGERVSGMAGIKPAEFSMDKKPGRGGAEPTQASSLSMTDFSRELDQVAHGVDSRSDFFSIMESELFNSRLASKRLPTVLPVNATYNSSGFGRRIDPFTGQSAQHEGIDFIAQPGTPIVAAAYGVVIAAEWHHDFGNMIEIDHGNDIVTRYAHTQAMFVKAGDIVKRGQKIAEVGSTGRATGPHLHFEVRFQGVAQNPVRFLQSADQLPPPPNMVAQNVGPAAAAVSATAGSAAVLPATAATTPILRSSVLKPDARIIP
ncbi:MAG TPA: M23 family metallopeptidase [Burkholderiales bacterium]|nr:M23 family metallopeptidase [Burkholderiales bacterium]